MSSWRWEDLDGEFLRGVASRLSPDWFWDVDKVPFLLEEIGLEIRKRLRGSGDSLLFPGLGLITLEDVTVGRMRIPQLRIIPASDWRIGKEERPVPPPPPPRPTDPVRRCPEMSNGG